MSELTETIATHLPDDLDEKVEDPDHGEETAAKNYGVPILKELGLKHADYEEIIESGDRPDFIWDDKDGITRIVGELKKPWDETYSEDNPRYKIEQAIEEARIYNDQLRLKYILATDGRYIFFSNEYDSPASELELDLLELQRNPDDDAGETIAQHSKNIHEAKRGLKTQEHSKETLFETFVNDDRTVSFRSKIRSVIDSQPYNIGSFTIEQNGTELSLNHFHTVEMHSEHEAAALAEFLEEFGDEYIAGDKLRDLELPELLDEFRDEHDTLQAKISEFETTIEEETDALNQAVYELYGVDDHQETIESYLDSFLKVVK